jgi:hypothetical protein
LSVTEQVATGGQCDLGVGANTLKKKPMKCRHVHLPLSKDGKNIFTGDKYAGLRKSSLSLP